MGERWRSATADSNEHDELVTAALGKYQDPAAADKLLKIQRELDETKIVLHKTIDSVLARGALALPCDGPLESDFTDWIIHPGIQARSLTTWLRRAAT